MMPDDGSNGLRKYIRMVGGRGDKKSKRQKVKKTKRQEVDKLKLTLT